MDTKQRWNLCSEKKDLTGKQATNGNSIETKNIIQSDYTFLGIYKLYYFPGTMIF